METVFESLDWFVLGVYFLLLVGVAVWVVLQKNKNTEDYFLAGRNVGWFVIGASIFASNIGSEHVVGLLELVLSLELQWHTMSFMLGLYYF